MDSIFKDLRVVELASVLAGPLVGSFLSEMGAIVYKIENKRVNGDITRQWKNKKENPEASFSSYYHSANYNKQTLLLDFNDSKDLDRLNELILTADVVVSNFQKRVGRKFGLDPLSLAKKKKELVIVQLDAYDHEDPRPGFDMVMQAESGFISMCGTIEGELVKMPVAIIDILAGHHMKEAVLIGLIHLLKTGKGSIAYVSLYQAALSALVNQGTNYLNQGLVAKPLGTQHPNIAPYGDFIYTMEGRPIMLAIGSDKQFVALLNVLKVEENDFKGLLQNHNRIVRRKELIELLNKYSRTIGYKKLTALLTNKGLPYGEVKALDEVFADKYAEKMVVVNDQGAKSIRHTAFHIVENN